MTCSLDKKGDYIHKRVVKIKLAETVLNLTNYFFMYIFNIAFPVMYAKSANWRRRAYVLFILFLFILAIKWAAVDKGHNFLYRIPDKKDRRHPVKIFAITKATKTKTNYYCRNPSLCAQLFYNGENWLHFQNAFYHH